MWGPWGPPLFHKGKVEAMVVRSIDYNQEPKLKHGDKTYTIIRTYDKDGELTELICQGVVNG